MILALLFYLHLLNISFFYNNIMKNNTLWVIIIIIVVIILGGFIISSSKSTAPSSYDQSGTEAFDQSIGDGLIMLSYSSDDFGLATNQQQILASSTTPVCTGDFIYCLYYKGSAYAGTNFESAGIRISKRADLKTENTCLNTPPQGYDNSVLPNTLKPQTKVSTSLFKNLSDSGAGHIVVFSIYRLFTKATSTPKSCYEFQTTIAKTDSSQKNAFTDEAANNLNARMTNILKNLTVYDDLGDIFPPY
jgi:hypothetical protein